MKRFNHDIRQACKEAGVYLYEIAEKMGISDMTISRKLRKELPAEEKAKIYTVIAMLKAGEE